MDILWMRHLAAPAKPGIYTLEDGSAQILVRGKDIEASKRLEGHEIHCVCVETFSDGAGTAVWEILWMTKHTTEDLIPGTSDSEETRPANEDKSA